VIGPGEVGLGLGAVGAEEAGAGGIGAASDRQRQPEGAVEGTDGAIVIVVRVGPVPAFGAVEKHRSEGQGAIRLRAWSSLAHRWGRPGGSLPFLRPREAFQLIFPPKKKMETSRRTAPVRGSQRPALAATAVPPHLPCGHLLFGGRGMDTTLGPGNRERSVA